MKRGKPLARRTPLKPGKPLKRTAFKRKLPSDPVARKRSSHSGQVGHPKPRKGLPAESAKRKAERPARARVRREVHERDGGCVAARFGLTGQCAGPLDVNELVRRGRWRAGYLVADNCVVLCRRHHDWVTTHVLEARALGLDLHAPPPRGVLRP